MSMQPAFTGTNMPTRLQTLTAYLMRDAPQLQLSMNSAPGIDIVSEHAVCATHNTNRKREHYT